MDNLEHIDLKNKFMVELFWLSFLIALGMTVASQDGLQTKFY